MDITCGTDCPDCWARFTFTFMPPADDGKGVWFMNWFWLGGWPTILLTWPAIMDGACCILEGDIPICKNIKRS